MQKDELIISSIHLEEFAQLLEAWPFVSLWQPALLHHLRGGKGGNIGKGGKRRENKAAEKTS
jgi:hypothetical protein